MYFLAYVCIILKCVIYGSTIYFTSQLTQNVDVLDLLALRFLLTFVLLWALKVTGVLKIRVGIKDFFREHDRKPFMKNLLLAALFEPVLYMLFETLGVSMSTNITAAVLISLSPISSCIIEEVFLKERSTVLQKIFLACGIFGVIYVAVNTDTVSGRDTVWGILFLLLSVASGSLFSAFSRKSSGKFNFLEITYFSSMLGALAFNSVNVVRHLIAGDILHYFDPYFVPENIVGFLFLGVVSSIMAVCMSNYALSKLQLSTYLEQLRSTTPDAPLLTKVGKITYASYYLSADGEILVPTEHEYTVSGNNTDGYIITVSITKSAVKSAEN